MNAESAFTVREYEMTLLNQAFEGRVPQFIRRGIFTHWCEDDGLQVAISNSPMILQEEFEPSEKCLEKILEEILREDQPRLAPEPEMLLVGGGEIQPPMVIKPPSPILFEPEPLTITLRDEHLPRASGYMLAPETHAPLAFKYEPDEKPKLTPVELARKMRHRSKVRAARKAHRRNTQSKH